jgi:hypothetical protein
MTTQEIIQLGDAFKEMAGDIKSDMNLLPELKEVLEEMASEIDEGFAMISDIMTDTPNEVIDEVTRVTVKAQSAKQMQGMNLEETDTDMRLIMNMVTALDKDIGQELFKPIMFNIIEGAAKIVKSVDTPIYQETYACMTNVLADY